MTIFRIRKNVNIAMWKHEMDAFAFHSQSTHSIHYMYRLLSRKTKERLNLCDKPNYSVVLKALSIILYLSGFLVWFVVFIFLVFCSVFCFCLVLNVVCVSWGRSRFKVVGWWGTCCPLCVSTFYVPCCDVRYDFHLHVILGSSLLVCYISEM